MRKILAVGLLMLAPLSAWGQTISFGSKVLSVGDPIGRVYEVAGKPSRTVELENKFGANLGERLEYFLGNKTVQITVRNGQVTNIVEIF